MASFTFYMQKIGLVISRRQKASLRTGWMGTVSAETAPSLTAAAFLAFLLSFRAA